MADQLEAGRNYKSTKLASFHQMRNVWSVTVIPWSETALIRYHTQTMELAGPITFWSTQTPRAQRLPIRVLGKTLIAWRKNRQRLSWNRQIYPAIRFTVKLGLGSPCLWSGEYGVDRSGWAFPVGNCKCNTQVLQTLTTWYGSTNRILLNRGI